MTAGETFQELAPDANAPTIIHAPELWIDGATPPRVAVPLCGRNPQTRYACTDKRGDVTCHECRSLLRSKLHAAYPGAGLPPAPRLADPLCRPSGYPSRVRVTYNTSRVECGSCRRRLSQHPGLANAIESARQLNLFEENEGAVADRFRSKMQLQIPY